MVGSFIMGALFILLCLTIVYLLGQCRAHAQQMESLRAVNTNLLKKAEFFEDKFALSQAQINQYAEREKLLLAQPILTPTVATLIAEKLIPYIVASTKRVQ